MILSADETGAVEEAILQLLKRIPERWEELDPEALSAVEEEALVLLTGAGLVERRFSIRLSLIGHQMQIEAKASATGEHGLIEAMEPVLRKAWDAWADFYKEHAEGPEEERPTFFCEQTGPESWRLTDQGALALQDIEAGDTKVVLDFVLKRTLVFMGKVVPGKGRAEKITAIEGESVPAKVEVTNLGELSGPMAQMANVMQEAFEKMAASNTGAATKKPAISHSSKRGRPEASERQADKQMALLARWTRAKEAGVTRKRFCADEGIEVKELERIQDWARQRKNRGKA
jgi:hypothetical protein